MEEHNDSIDELNALIDRTAHLVYDLTTLHCTILLTDKQGKYTRVLDEVRQFSDELIERYHVISGTLDEITESDEDDEATLEWLKEHEDTEEDGFLTIEMMINNDPRSMTKFAKDAGVNRDTLKRFLSGAVSPHTKTLRGIEKALGLPEGSIDV